ncbi:cuticle protein 7-like [Palaemon carinicauda]|uniref:cuticle protein 7-like n=1 Tax=Palaemon carinicauda TaxID=392227 RepID=UPI0035B62C98
MKPFLSQVLLVAALAIASVAADLAPSYHAPAPSYHAPAPAGPAQYDFNYAVKDDYSKNDFGHQETRNGYDTKGTYYVQLPDGRLQKVTYYVNGDSGYVAEVSYQGEAYYQQPAPKVLILAAVAIVCANADLSPSYGRPAPSYHAPAPAGPAQYDFNYAVKDDYSKNDFGQQETRNGYDTKGTYYVQLPDGRLQKVTYYVNGDSGYVAEVSYQGEAYYQPAPKVGYA